VYDQYGFTVGDDERSLLDDCYEIYSDACSDDGAGF